MVLEAIDMPGNALDDEVPLHNAQAMPTDTTKATKATSMREDNEPAEVHIINVTVVRPRPHS